MSILGPCRRAWCCLTWWGAPSGVIQDTGVVVRSSPSEKVQPAARGGMASRQVTASQNVPAALVQSSSTYGGEPGKAHNSADQASRNKCSQLRPSCCQQSVESETAWASKAVACYMLQQAARYVPGSCSAGLLHPADGNSMEHLCLQVPSSHQHQLCSQDTAFSPSRGSLFSSTCTRELVPFSKPLVPAPGASLISSSTAP